MAYIEVNGIIKNYGKTGVLKGASFYVNPGECVAIVGANGCGKSTLLGVLSGSHKADGGSMSINGQSPFKNKKIFSSYIGFIPQENPLMENLTVLDNLKFWYSGTGRDLKQDLVNGVPAVFGVNQYLNKNVNALSGGMKKRLSITCALAKNPPVLILDEPGASLDVVCKQDILNYLEAYKKSGGTIILTSHEEGELKLADRMYLLKNGILEELNGNPVGNQLMSIIRA
ncbi:MAG: ATP-binding cassette domain-containing protein [Eubacteriales bacterium]|nr:ATP-binding cassette domain-containing protein [Eubacteriales bacterium]